LVDAECTSQLLASEPRRSGGVTALAGAIAMVTGAAGGIGSAVSQVIAAAGAEVHAADITGAAIDLDVADPAAVDAAVDRIIHDRGRLDVVVTAAGIGVAGPLEEVTLDEWRRVFDVNLWGTVNLVRTAYPHMISQGGGHLALLASLSGLVPTPLLVPYATTKSAVVGLGASLRPEARRHGVAVTTVCPGPVDTRMLDDGGELGAVRSVNVRRYLTAAAGPPITPTRVAQAVVAGIEKNRPLVLPGRARLVALGARLAPRQAERIVTRAMSRSGTG
jgi:NAD(P)-dependent dehydrogenase (short-subunit alcohol dehydrogenase family)